MTSSAHLERKPRPPASACRPPWTTCKSSVTTTAITNGAMTFAKEGSTAVARAAIDRAMASPLAAMLIGAGVFMLMTGGNKDSKVGAVVAQGQRGAEEHRQHAGRRGLEHRRRGVERAVGGLARLGRGVRHRRRHGRQGQEARRATPRTMATGAYDKAKTTAEDLTAQGRDQGKQAIEQTQAMVTEAQGRLEQFAREQPILVAALGVAFGAALGASLPMTKAEQDYMGDAARKAGELGTDIAKKVADSVTHEVSGGDVKAKVGEVADAITSTVTGGDVKAKVGEVADPINSAVTTSIAAKT